MSYIYKYLFVSTYVGEINECGVIREGVPIPKTDEATCHVLFVSVLTGKKKLSSTPSHACVAMLLVLAFATGSLSPLREH